MIKDDRDAGIISAYQSGKTLAEAGALFGIGVGGAFNVLKKHGVPRRGKGRIKADSLKHRVQELERRVDQLSPRQPDDKMMGWKDDAPMAEYGPVIVTMQKYLGGARMRIGVSIGTADVLRNDGWELV